MELEHVLPIPADIERAWSLLRDPHLLARCMPGATIDEVEGTQLRGSVRVKLGPMNVRYQGTAVFRELDETARTAVIDASGHEARGSGTATATIRLHLREEGPAATRARVLTQLDITGRPAQLGRGLIDNVADKLLREFTDRLAGELGAPEVAREADGPAMEARPQLAGTSGSTTDALDLASLVDGRLVRRALVAVAAAALLLVMGGRIRRRRAFDTRGGPS